MHYFSPVNKMPLLEVIATAKTLPEVVATAVAVGKRQGKTVIVVNDGVGFYTSRILAPYMHEASLVLVEGAAVEDVDKALGGLRLPGGPHHPPGRGGDRRGAQGRAHHARRLRRAHGRPRCAREGGGRRTPRSQVEEGLLPLWRGTPRREEVAEQVDVPSTTSFRVGEERKPVDLHQVAERVTLQMVNEAVLCLQQGILRSAREGDIGAIFGLGFPPFRGGPFRYIDAQGPSVVLAKLESLAAKHGKRFAPAELLIEKARKSERFYP